MKILYVATDVAQPDNIYNYFVSKFSDTTTTNTIKFLSIFTYRQKQIQEAFSKITEELSKDNYDVVIGSDSYSSFILAQMDCGIERVLINPICCDDDIDCNSRDMIWFVFGTDKTSKENEAYYKQKYQNKAFCSFVSSKNIGEKLTKECIDKELSEILDYVNFYTYNFGTDKEING